MNLANEKTLAFVIWKLYAKIGNKDNIFRVEALKDLLDPKEKAEIPYFDSGCDNTNNIEIWKNAREKIFDFLDDLRLIFGCNIKFGTAPDYEDEISHGISSSDYSIEGYLHYP